MKNVTLYPSLLMIISCAIPDSVTDKSPSIVDVTQFTESLKVQGCPMTHTPTKIVTDKEMKAVVTNVFRTTKIR